MGKQKKYADNFREFWDSVERWRSELRANLSTPLTKPAGLNIQRAQDGGPGNESLNRLENAWQQCQSFNEWPGINGRDVAQRVARDPLGAVFGFVSMGLYPPPEVMLAAMDCYERYIEAEGALELEEAFFGKRVQGRGGGSFAARRAQSNRDFRIAMDLAIYNRDGFSDDEAAERVSLNLEKDGVSIGVERIKDIANTLAPRVSRKK